MDAKTRRNAWQTGIASALWSFVLVQALVLIGANPAARAESPAAPAFDRTFSAVGPAADAAGGVGLAGPVVTRFAPPVAAPVDPASATLPLALTRSPLLRPCDTPGSGCRNPQTASTPVVVPPIGPGTRPPTPPNP